MHPCQYFTHLWHFAFGLVLGHSNFNNTLFQWFFVFLGHPVQGVPKNPKTIEINVLLEFE